MAETDEKAVAAERETVTIGWGEEKFSPVQYQSFTVGSFYATTKVRDGETHEQAGERLWQYLDALARKTFVAKRKGFYERMKESRMTRAEREADEEGY